MANKSGVSDQVISLPEGGGALEGIGEKFSPDLFTGTGNFSVPINLPEGRNEFQPDLTLTYSTGNGNGPFGLGWQLSVPGVSRKTSEGVPIYDDSTDVFVLSGAEDLVPVLPESDDEWISDPETQQQYRPRTEGLFARIVHHTNQDTDHWEVWSKDGLKSWYGTPADRDTDSAVVADPDDREQVFEWKLTRTEDPFGNRIIYEYDRDSGQDGRQQHHWDQVYLKRIKYVDFEGNEADDDGEDTERNYLISVEFEYEDRPDPFSTYTSGFEIRTRKRCSRIIVKTHADEDGAYIEDGRRIRSYELTYLDERDDLADRQPRNGMSLLSQVQVIGHKGDETEAMPPLEFGHTRFAPEGKDFFPLEGDIPMRSLASPDLEIADLFGNGLPDIVEINGTVRYWQNQGDGRFGPPREMDASPAGLELADAGVQLLDADGDGQIDLMTTVNGVAGYFPTRHDGEWDRRSFQPYDVAPSVNLEDPDTQLVDLTGDGVTDAIRSGSRLECFFNDPNEGWNDTRRVPRQGVDVSFSDERVKWGDLSGDGLQDIVLVYDGDVEYWPNLGHGDWGNQVAMENSPRFPSGYDPRRILVGDVDGDGLADIVYVDHERVLLWINQSGNAWSEPIEIDGTPPVTDADAVRLVDMCGTGVPGVLWTADARGGRDNMFFLDFTGGVKPYLLNEMDNRRGATTKVEYEPSTRFYLEDKEKSETRWETSLPFPVQVVSRVEMIDDISGGKQTTEYRYHHGYWDGAEREFRGFGMVEQLDTETFEEYNEPGLHGDETDFERVGKEDREQFSPPLLTKTWFHQGPIGDEFGGWEEADYSHEYWAEDPQVMTRPESVTETLQELPRRAKRDALRALRGRKLRTELYALDGSMREDRPYTVTERLYGVREESPPEDGRLDRRRIFFPHELGKRTTQWERGEDPMTRFAFTGDYDAYGQSRSEIEIAVPRNRDFTESVSSPEEPYLATKTKTTYAQRDDAERYIVDRVARTTEHEISNDGRDDVFTLKRKIENDTLGEAPDLIGQTVHFYDGDPFEGLDFGEVGEYGARVRSEKLALTDEIIDEAYGVDGVGSIPPYLTVDGPGDWSEYPDEFRDLLSITDGTDSTRPGLDVTPVGYGVTAGTDTYEPGYFVATERREYDVQDGSEGKGLVKTKRGPRGDDTSIEYDEFGHLPVEVKDPAGLITTAAYDYRVMQPELVTDPNGNRTAYTFTPLGLLGSTAEMGEEDEDLGDTPEQPGTLFEYDFLAFDDSPPDDPQPIFVHTKQREQHREEEFIESREYSDGFGRLLQTRTLAEDVVYGDGTDESPFGGIDLLIDQGVLVHDDGGFTPDSLDELAGHSVGARNRSTAEGFVKRRLIDSGVVNEGDFKTYSSEREAINALESDEVDAVVMDDGEDSLATRFATEEDEVTLAFSSGPGEVVGRELSDGDSQRVVVDGWKTYDNKGRVVEEYEPFFDVGWEYLSRGEAEADAPEAFGQKVTKYYDPRGQVIRTVNPDGSEKRVIYARPEESDLDSPDEFVPTPWEAYTYDPNDNAGRTHDGPDAPESLHVAPASDYQHHWNTPSSEVVDALGRTVETVRRNREPGDGSEDPEAYRTRSTFDIRGNELTVTDPLGRKAFDYAYDLRDNRIRTESIDAGDEVIILDAAGNEIERRDGKGALVLQAYDEMDRPIRLWARDDESGPETPTLREYVVYGDSDEGPSEDDARDRNLRGNRYRHYDEAGMVSFEEYDFKANLTEKERRVIDDAVIPEELPVDWQPSDTTLGDREATLLEDTGYLTSMEYDALNRMTKQTFPNDQDGERKELRSEYNRRGALKAVEMDSPSSADVEGAYVEHIAYDAKGQRTFVAYGNGVMTRYAYDHQTFRLVRLRSERYDRSAVDPPTYSPDPDGEPLQDFAYEYDLAGNVTTIRDRAPNSGVQDTPLGRHALDREFEYDALSRLKRATGRECESLLANRPMQDFEPCGYYRGNGPPDVTRRNAPEHTVPYWEEYDYDPAGNMVKMQHGSGDSGGRWTRHFGIGGRTRADWEDEWQDHFEQWTDPESPTEWDDPPGNQLTHATVGDPDPAADPNHTYDENGNLIEERASQNGHFEWDHNDRLRNYQKDDSINAYYLYDSNGQRVKKVVLNESGGDTSRKVNVYIEGAFEHYRSHPDEGSPPETENNTLHVMDDEKRIATVRVGDLFNSEDETLVIKYHLGDHLDSSSVVVNGSGSWINREEYFPFGETSFGSYAKKRYRFTGKERDEESGLYYHGARYYLPWLARWCSTDPVGPTDSMNLYRYTRSNPIRFIDTTGTDSDDPHAIKRADPGREEGTGSDDPDVISRADPGREEIRNRGDSGSDELSAAVEYFRTRLSTIADKTEQGTETERSIPAETVYSKWRDYVTEYHQETTTDFGTWDPDFLKGLHEKGVISTSKYDKLTQEDVRKIWDVVNKAAWKKTFRWYALEHSGDPRPIDYVGAPPTVIKEVLKFEYAHIEYFNIARHGGIGGGVDPTADLKYLAKNPLGNLTFSVSVLAGVDREKAMNLGKAVGIAWDAAAFRGGRPSNHVGAASWRETRYKLESRMRRGNRTEATVNDSP